MLLYVQTLLAFALGCNLLIATGFSPKFSGCVDLSLFALNEILDGPTRLVVVRMYGQDFGDTFKATRQYLLPAQSTTQPILKVAGGTRILGHGEHSIG
jgi:hypothetical protein